MEILEHQARTLAVTQEEGAMLELKEKVSPGRVGVGARQQRIALN